jgi:hypothetical protein
MDGFRNQPLRPTKQAAIEQDAPIRGTLKDLKTAFLGNGLKLEMPLVDVERDRT